jgi:AraC-like DNA-binding protein
MHANNNTSSTCLAPRFLFIPHVLSIATPCVISRPCKRPAVTLLLSANERLFRVFLPSVGTIDATAVLIGPGQVRGLHADGCDLLSVNIEPGHDRYNFLRDRLRSDSVVIYPGRYFSGLRDELRSVYDGNVSRETTMQALELILDVAGGKAHEAWRADPRIGDILSQIHASLPERPALASLAKSVGLSDDRLSHLFVETIGTPLRSYIVWQRYKSAIAQLSRSEGLTNLANNCGFSDAAHMTRTFVSFFGLSPSLLQRSGLTQDFLSGR